MQTRHPLLGKCLAAVLALTLAGPALAGYSQIIAFGDSLSDTGNLYRMTSTSLGFGVPGKPYVDGRFSNGPLAVEWLASDLGVGVTSYAFGGAQTGPANQAGLLLDGTGVAGQIRRFATDLDGQPADQKALYFLWAGPNDFYTGVNMTLPATSQTAASNMLGNVMELYYMGAQDFFIPLMPDLSQTPASLAESLQYQSDAAQRTQEYNSLLVNGLQHLAASAPGLNVTVFDTVAFMTRRLHGMDAQGLNTVDACYSIASGSVCSTPDSYLFWDGQHPTTAANAVLAQAFAAAVPEPGKLPMALLGLMLIAWQYKRQAAGTEPKRLT